MRPFKFFFLASLAVFAFFFVAKFVIMALIAATVLSVLFFIVRKVRMAINYHKWNDHWLEEEDRFALHQNFPTWAADKEKLFTPHYRDRDWKYERTIEIY